MANYPPVEGGQAHPAIVESVVDGSAFVRFVEREPDAQVCTFGNMPSAFLFICASPPGQPNCGLPNDCPKALTSGNRSVPQQVITTTCTYVPFLFGYLAICPFGPAGLWPVILCATGSWPTSRLDNRSTDAASHALPSAGHRVFLVCSMYAIAWDATLLSCVNKRRGGARACTQCSYSILRRSVEAKYQDRHFQIGHIGQMPTPADA